MTIGIYLLLCQKNTGTSLQKASKIIRKITIIYPYIIIKYFSFYNIFLKCLFVFYSTLIIRLNAFNMCTKIREQMGIMLS